MKISIKKVREGTYAYSVKSNIYGDRANGCGSLFFAIKQIIKGYIEAYINVAQCNIYHYGNIWGCGKRLTDDYGRKLKS